MANNVLDLVTQHYSRLTRSEKKIANYIFLNEGAVEYLSITSFAEQCGVGEATIFRFCKSLGFGGYHEFKVSLAKSFFQAESSNPTCDFPVYGKVNPKYSFSDMCRKLHTSQLSALSQTLELLDEKQVVAAARFLSNAQRVYCIGQGGSLIIAMEAWSRFISVSPNFFCVEDAHLQSVISSLLGKNDVILFFSYSGATRDMADILPVAKKNGTKVILVTHFAKSPATSYADAVLLCGSNEGPLQVGSVAAKMAQLMVIDVLFNQFWLMNPKMCTENVGITADSTAKKLL